MSDAEPFAGAADLPDEVARVEDLPVDERADAYLRVERALQERLGLGGP